MSFLSLLYRLKSRFLVMPGDRPGGNGLCKGRLLAESLENRVLLSAIDYADLVIDEIEPNDTLQNAQELPFDIGNDITAIGLDTDLSSSADVDIYEFEVASAGQIQLKFEISEGLDADITSLACGPDNLAYFVADNRLWRQSSSGSTNSADLLLTAEEIAAATVPPTPVQDIDISDIAVTETTAEGSEVATTEVFITLGQTGTMLIASEDTEGVFTISVAVDTAGVTTVTAYPDANVTEVAVDADGVIYLLDNTSESLLKVTRAEGDIFTVTQYASNDNLTEAIERDVRNDLAYAAIEMPATVLGSTNGYFAANSLLLGSGNYGPAQGESEVYYTTQLGSAYDGDGSITRIVTNEDDASAAIFTEFFEPETVDELALNPSALALDTNGAFGSLMFMGTFGTSFGDDQDGQIYTVDTSGDITEFAITSYVDMQGQDALIDGNAVTGFFDVTDMAFSFGGAFGTYLYVISENVDTNGPDLEGGYSSDIWRVSPDGVAQLFVDDIVDGAISLAFDDTFAYASDLFVGSFDTGQIMRVDNAGSVSEFFDFGELGDVMVSDIAFAPSIDNAVSPLEDQMIVTIKSGSYAYLVQIEPNGVDFQTWASSLQAGDVSSADIAFDTNGNVVICQAGDTKNIMRLDYQDILDYTLGDLQLRTKVTDEPVEGGDEGETEEVTTYEPYLLVDVANAPRIIRVGDGTDAYDDDIVTELGSAHLDTEADGLDTKLVSYTFDSDGNLYVYVQNDGALYKSERDDEDGNFSSLSSLMTQDAIYDAMDTIALQVDHLAWASDGSLFASATDDFVGPTGGDVPDEPVGYSVMKLGSTLFGWSNPENTIPSTELTYMSVTVTGPDLESPWQYDYDASGLHSQELEGLTAGTYTVAVESVRDSSGDYELVTSIAGDMQDTHTVTGSDGPLVLTNLAGERIQLSVDGYGEVQLVVNQKPSGTIIDIVSVSIVRAGASTEVDLVNLDDPGDLAITNLFIAAPLRDLNIGGSIETVQEQGNRGGTIKSFTAGAVGTIVATNYKFKTVILLSLGDQYDSGTFLAKSISTLKVSQDINNITFLNSISRNTYQQIIVGGTINASTFYGKQLNELLVTNDQDEQNAVQGSTFNFSDTTGRIKDVQITQGDVHESYFVAGKMLDEFKMLNGDLQDSQVNGGDKLKRVVISGDVSEQSQIIAYTTRHSSIDRIIIGGDVEGAIQSLRIDEVFIGYDNQGERRDEVPGTMYTGSDFTGTLSSVFKIRELNVTGSIDGAQIECSAGAINKIFAEDGLEDVVIQARKNIKSIFVGYLDGKRSAIINSNADVSGYISATRLTRLYYTGTVDPTMTLPRHTGVLHDDVP